MSAHIIERAFQLAQSGDCRSLTEIQQQLRREGFTRIPEHLHGRSIKNQLNRLMIPSRCAAKRT